MRSEGWTINSSLIAREIQTPPEAVKSARDLCKGMLDTLGYALVAFLDQDSRNKESFQGQDKQFLDLWEDFGEQTAQNPHVSFAVYAVNVNAFNALWNSYSYNREISSCSVQQDPPSYTSLPYGAHSGVLITLRNGLGHYAEVYFVGGFFNGQYAYSQRFPWRSCTNPRLIERQVDEIVSHPTRYLFRLSVSSYQDAIIAMLSNTGNTNLVVHGITLWGSSVSSEFSIPYGDDRYERTGNAIHSASLTFARFTEGFIK